MKTNQVKHIHDNQNGFSLIELLIVVIVIGIIAGISILGYTAVVSNTKDTLQSFRLAEYAKAQANFRTVKGKRRYGTLNELCTAGLLATNVVVLDGSCSNQTPINGWIIEPLDEGTPGFLTERFRAKIRKSAHTENDGPIYCVNEDGVMRKSVKGSYTTCTDTSPPAQ